MWRQLIEWLPGPIVVAPMAGGPSGPTLVAAADASGSLGFLAGGYQSPAQLEEQIESTRAIAGSFGVNLFAPNPVPVDPEAFQRYATALRPLAERFGVDVFASGPVEDDDSWDAKVDLLVRAPVPVVSFTFGIPDARVVRRLRRAGTVTIQTVTSSAEAAAAADAGMDAVIVQAFRAGGHSATLSPELRLTDMPLPDLVRSVTGTIDLPVIAAGGVSTALDAVAVLGAGAAAVMVGTALLRAPESGTSAVHRAALASRPPTSTVLTRAFTGRPARGIRNEFIDRFDAIAPLGYPALHHLTSPIRKAAAAAGDASAAHLWAGTGYAEAPDDPAGLTIGRLSLGL